MLLESITTPEDLKALRLEQLPQLAEEIRGRIIEVVSHTGGHLASSLGAVELIIALHYCLDLARDRIIFDVGHQAYAHKILTGRNKDFASLRQYQGISGFPSKDESVYDKFTTGHSSTAVSLALGLACARDCSEHEQYFKVVAVIGDGSLSGGLCFEGLNNAGHLKKDILVILNTNELSIAPNVGALSTYLNKIISLPIYNRFRNSLESLVKSRIPKGSRLMKIANKFEEGLKGLFIPGILFEELGFRYFGPLDGHNLNLLIPTLKNLLNIKGPILLHVVTKKGKGYSPAEDEPVRFHSASPFDIKTGKALSEKQTTSPVTYTQAFSEKLAELASSNKKIVAITAAMAEGTGLDKFRGLYPERFFDVGIAEAHAVCFASGLAKEGLRPVVAIYSSFLQRAYDQIIEEVALQNLGVVLAIDRAGIVGADGPTHQGIFDIAFLRNIPNLVMMAPKDKAELEAMLEFAINLDRPVSFRYPKDKLPIIPLPCTEIKLAKAEVLREGKDIALIALGSMVSPSLLAAEILAKEGIQATVINSRFIKPMDIDLFRKIGATFRFIFTVEEGILSGGFGSAVREAIEATVINIGLPTEFIPHGRRDILLEKYGLTKDGLAGQIRQAIRSING
ncbi:MAG: 1-deoxy-D-xylulose-5-phosphate synthase [Candidatus Omnitrophica bacterium]|nr:1-deoxy-D-xylulose-5-phosphate synthase [Candidatus Omnitrophota bacterium]MBU4473004.1 1-deoxy-D-xylulose-5-phosphate synthase [Candidatus Omnitrophota bacterium]MCG2706820.1 1-deoxy-D-xylulose-5-phosphate synthase [Candidatus Omnitrophota bacterium]